MSEILWSALMQLLEQNYFQSFSVLIPHLAAPFNLLELMLFYTASCLLPLLSLGDLPQESNISWIQV